VVLKIAAGVLKLWIPLAIAISAMCLLVYGAVQHSIRSAADDPQIEIARDVAARLDAGLEASKIVPPVRRDISKTLSVFVIIFDSSGKDVASDAELDGKVPQVPLGVFDYVRSYGEHRFSWKPKPGVRSAAVVRPYKDGFVLAGRSLLEVEKRESRLLVFVAIAWVVTLGATFAASLVLELLTSGLISPKIRKR